jgi:hypothetical protein
VKEWILSAPAVWERDLHGMRLRVVDSCDADLMDDDLGEPKDLGALWAWQVSRVVDGFTAIELESGREVTCELAMTAAEGAAGTWR